MKKRNLAFAFLAIVIIRLLLSLYMAPQFNGADVAIFRDAGSNLALFHRFEAPGLPYVGDFQPRLFAHYTPLAPFVYGVFASIFGFGPKTATFFWLLLGSVLAGTALLLVQKSGLKSFSAHAAVILVLTSLPETFFDPDRPEAVGLILWVLAMITGLRTGAGALLLSSILVGLTFLAHPFAGILTAVWMTAIRYTQVLEGRATVAQSAAKLVLCGITSGVLILITVIWYRSADPTAIHRFMDHAFHQGGGLGQHIQAFRPASGLAQHSGYLSMLSRWMTNYRASLKHGIFVDGTHSEMLFLLLVASMLAVVLWWLRVGRKSETSATGTATLTCLISIFLTLVIFPGQFNYYLLVVGAIPFGCAAMGTAYETSHLAELGCLLFAIVGCIRAPIAARHILLRTETRSSYLESLSQPAKLLSLLPSKNAVVVINGGGYDVFKAEIKNIVQAGDLMTGQDLSAVAGIINCYDSVGGTSPSLLPIPSSLDSSQFRLVERASPHIWLTVFGRRISQSQWGWGCDLYTREPLPSNNLQNK